MTAFRYHETGGGPLSQPFLHITSVKGGVMGGYVMKDWIAMRRWWENKRNYFELYDLISRVPLFVVSFLWVFVLFHYLIYYLLLGAVELEQLRTREYVSFKCKRKRIENKSIIKKHSRGGCCLYRSEHWMYIFINRWYLVADENAVAVFFFT